MEKTKRVIFKNKSLFIALLLLLILSKAIISINDYENIDDRSKYDFESYQKIAKTLIGQNTDITRRDWQYPPLYSILIIPTLFYDTDTYLMILNIILSVISMYFLFLFCHIFIDKNLSAILSFTIVLLMPSFSIVKIGMPISLCSMLFIIFSYNLYKIKRNFDCCSISFMLLMFTKYLFIALIPCIIYWIYLRYRYKPFKKTIIFFIIPVAVITMWFIRNAIVNGFNMSGILGGYDHINLNLYLIPNKSIFSFTDPQSIYIMLIYLLFLITFVFIKYDVKKRYYIYISFNKIMFIYFLLTFFMFGFLYEVDGLRIRYFIYQTPIIFMFICLNIYLIDKHKSN